MKPTYTWSDAWMLLSVALADRGSGATLSEVIAQGDLVNHAIFTGAELKRGFAKLVYSGHIAQRGDKFFIIGKAKDFWKSFRADFGETYSRPRLMEGFENFLKVATMKSMAAKTDDPAWTYPYVTDLRIKQAYEQYLATFPHGKRVMNKSNKKKRLTSRSTGRAKTARR